MPRTPTPPASPAWLASSAPATPTRVVIRVAGLEASRRAAPTWFTVDIGFVERFTDVVPLETLKATAGLESMMVTQKGSRLSVQPVTAAEFAIVVRLGRRAKRRS
jgi:hypothetical protein